MKYDHDYPFDKYFEFLTDEDQAIITIKDNNALRIWLRLGLKCQKIDGRRFQKMAKHTINLIACY